MKFDKNNTIKSKEYLSNFIVDYEKHESIIVNICDWCISLANNNLL